MPVQTNLWTATDRQQKIARIEFDGGTSCNVPAKGYGNGYGSYKRDDEPVHRCNFNRPMSANAAEIYTLIYAIKAAKENGATALLIVGDSQIALKWADVVAGNRKATKIGKTSDVFQEAVADLHYAMEGITSVETRWQARLKSVATFGH